MGTTSELLIPYPELPDVADGPDGFKDQADRMEANRPIMRARTHISQYPPSGGIPIGATKLLYDQTFPAVAVGWVQINLSVLVYNLDGLGNKMNADGELILFVNGAEAGKTYWHTQNVASNQLVSAMGYANLPRATTTIQVLAHLSVGPLGSAQIQPAQLNGDIVQFGAVR